MLLRSMIRCCLIRCQSGFPSRKDLVEELAKPLWWLDRKGEVPEGALGAYPLRIVHYHQVS